MAYSIQREVSDGTLVLLDISIDYIERSEISVLFDGVVQVKGDTWDWVGTVDSKLSFTPAVGNGVEVSVVRQTDYSDLRHRFSEGAAFTANSMDEALKQVLHIAQESAEQVQGTDFYNYLDMHGYLVKNVGDGVDPGDAANIGQMTAHDATIIGYRNEAEGFADDAEASALAAATAHDATIGYRDQALVYRNEAEGFADDAEASALAAATAVGSYAGTQGIFAGGTLSQADIGKVIIFGSTAAGQVIYLPPLVGLPAGATITIHGCGTFDYTIGPQGGQDILARGTVLTSLPMKGADSAVLYKESDIRWVLIGGTVQEAYSPRQASSLASNGYQKLPSGLIIQWGVSPAMAGGSHQTITFPIAFPAGCVSAVASLESSFDSSTPCNANVTRISASQLAVRNFGTASMQASWLAIGY